MTDRIVDALSALVQPGDRLFIGYLLVAFLVAGVVATRQRSGQSLRSAVLPKEVYLHRSAKTDYRYFFSSRILFVLLTAPLSAAAVGVASQTRDTLGAISGGDWFDGPALEACFSTIVALLAVDIAIYIAHRAQHRSSVLWEFHKVHHSAEVMTPFTVYRMHPIDDLVVAGATVAVQGTALGVTAWITGTTSLWLIFGINLGTFLFYALGFNLRHSHIWLSYGPRVERCLISPAMHQLHHSVEVEHYDTNYGFMFSWWDRLGGTLLIPQERVQVVFGLSGGESADYRSVRDLYVMPFRKLRRRAIQELV